MTSWQNRKLISAPQGCWKESQIKSRIKQIKITKYDQSQPKENSKIIVVAQAFSHLKLNFKKAKNIKKQLTNSTNYWPEEPGFQDQCSPKTLFCEAFAVLFEGSWPRLCACPQQYSTNRGGTYQCQGLYHIAWRFFLGGGAKQIVKYEYNQSCLH